MIMPITLLFDIIYLDAYRSFLFRNFMYIRWLFFDKNQKVKLNIPCNRNQSFSTTYMLKGTGGNDGFEDNSWLSNAFK